MRDRGLTSGSDALGVSRRESAGASRNAGLHAVFSALADPHRRFVLETLAAGGAATPTELAARLPVTRQAVTKHLATLRDAGLVEVERTGRETRYALKPEPLASATAWIESVGAAWDSRLEALRRLVERG
jgi:DNA-binding transcriptional ArsR family regulator